MNDKTGTSDKSDKFKASHSWLVILRKMIGIHQSCASAYKSNVVCKIVTASEIAKTLSSL